MTTENETLTLKSATSPFAFSAVGKSVLTINQNGQFIRDGKRIEELSQAELVGVIRDLVGIMRNER